MILARRNFLVGLIAAPAIVRVASIMPVRPIDTWTVVFEAAYHPEELFDYGNALGMKYADYWAHQWGPALVNQMYHAANCMVKGRTNSGLALHSTPYMAYNTKSVFNLSLKDRTILDG